MAFDLITPAFLGRTAISVSPTVDTVYTAPVLTRTLVKDIDIANTSAVAIDVTLYLVPSGGAPSNSNTLIPAVTIPANGMFQWCGTQILNAGDSIRVTASALGATVHVSGGEAI